MIPSPEEHQAALDAAFLTLPMNNRSFRETVEKAIAAYLSALPAKAEGWQPIETAPGNDFQGKVLIVGGAWPKPSLVKNDGNWWRFRLRSADGAIGVPTHWQHLPAPPEGETP